MKEFKVNEFITLRLEEEKTVIYVAGERFQQCKFLLLNISVDQISTISDIESIDEATERLSHSLEPIDESYSNFLKWSYDIPPEVEFWGHCSNLQVWSEGNYDTRLLKSDLAFPLLKKLVDKGDQKARKVFKEEIAKRLSSGYYNVIEYLFEQDYIKYLGNEELWVIITPLLEKLKKNNYQVRLWTYKTELPLLLLRKLVYIGDAQAFRLLKEAIIEVLQTGNIMNIEMLYDGGYINYLSREEFWSVFGQDGAILKNFENQINQYILVTSKDSFGIDVTKKKKKTTKELSYFNLSNGIFVDDGPMVFTFENGHITGLGIWSGTKSVFEVNLLPSEVFQLIHLKELTLSNVNLKEVLSEIYKFKSLKSLSLSGNLITYLPNEICKLDQLEYLGLSWNKLNMLPKCIKRLTNLQKIHIQANPLTKETINYLKQLEKKKKLVLYLDSP